MRGKALEVERVNEAWRGSQQLQRERENTHSHSLKERDTLISQLRTALHTRTKETEVRHGDRLSTSTIRSSRFIFCIFYILYPSFQGAKRSSPRQSVDGFW